MKGAEEQASINKLNQKGGVNLEQYGKAAEIPAIKEKTEARQDLDKFTSAKNSGNRQLAISSYVGSMVKRGRLNEGLMEQLKSKGVIDNIGRIINEKISGVDEKTLQAMESDLRETNNKASIRAQRAEQFLRGQGIDPSVIYGNDTASETAPSLGLKPIQ